MNLSLEEFVFESREADGTSELFALYQRLLQRYGFDQICFAVTGEHPSLANKEIPKVLGQKRLKRWVDHYMENNYTSIDPVHKFGLANPGLFVWDDVIRENELAPRQIQIFDEARERSLHQGATIAVHGQNLTKSATLLSCSDNKESLDPRWRDIVNLASYQLHFCMVSQLNRGAEILENPLSFKEQEVLKWIAQGFTKSDVSDKLNMSSHTVDYHIRNILRRLDAKNTVAATVIAITENLISI